MDLFLTVKVGVAIVTPAQQNAEELVRCADSALSKAKERIGEAVCYFENEQDELMMRDLRVANALTVALKRKEISVFLQPKVSLESRDILGFEALARWKSPELGDISPAIFIPAAEKNGKIRQLEQHVIEQVLSWLKKRQEQELELRQVAINISAEHFFHHSFVPYLVDETNKFGVDPKWIQLEITERIGVVDIDTAGTVFDQLKNMALRHPSMILGQAIRLSAISKSYLLKKLRSTVLSCPIWKNTERVPSFGPSFNWRTI